MMYLVWKNTKLMDIATSLLCMSPPGESLLDTNKLRFAFGIKMPGWLMLEPIVHKKCIKGIYVIHSPHVAASATHVLEINKVQPQPK